MATIALKSPNQAVPTSLQFGNAAVLAFVIVQYLDGVFTYFGIHVWGLQIEANPLISSAISVAGVGPGLALAKLSAIGFGIVLHLRGVHAVVALLTAFYFTVAILPWTMLFLNH
jgi:hypothetical protein